jgi:hypothetical protein
MYLTGLFCGVVFCSVHRAGILKKMFSDMTEQELVEWHRKTVNREVTHG